MDAKQNTDEIEKIAADVVFEDKKNFIIDGMKAGIYVYKYENKIIVHVFNIHVGLLDKDKPNYKITGLNSNPDNVGFVFEALETKFDVLMQGSIIRTNCDEEKYICDIKYTNIIIIKAEKKDGSFFNPNDVFVVHENTIKYEINYPSFKKVSVKPDFIVSVNGSCLVQDLEFNKGMLIMIEEKKKLDKNEKLSEEYSSLQEEFNKFETLSFKCTSYTLQKGVFVPLSAVTINDGL